jgi:hypothetical protein
MLGAPHQPVKPHHLAFVAAASCTDRSRRVRGGRFSPPFRFSTDAFTCTVSIFSVTSASDLCVLCVKAFLFFSFLFFSFRLAGPHKKIRATRFNPRRPLLIDSRSCCLSSPPTRAGSVLPAPPPVNFTGKLLFLAPLVISARSYPGRIFESSAKSSASALVLVNPV